MIEFNTINSVSVSIETTLDEAVVRRTFLIYVLNQLQNPVKDQTGTKIYVCSILVPTPSALSTLISAKYALLLFSNNFLQTVQSY